MKLRWHLLALLTSLVVVIVVWLASNGPLWLLNGFEDIRFAGYCEASKQLRSVVVRDQGKTWHLETRDVRNGKLVKEVLLNQPVAQGNIYIIANGITVQPSKAPLVVVQTVRPNGNRMEWCYLFDPETGVLLRKAPFLLKGFVMPVVSGNRVAIVTERDLWLFDEKHAEGRSLNIVGIECLEVSHDGKWIAYSGQDGVYIIDWETGNNLQALESAKAEAVFSMAFQRDGRLLLANYSGGFRMSRWRWNGKTLQLDSPVFVALDRIGGGPIQPLRIIDEGSHCHVASYAYVGWAAEIRTACQWLESQGWNVQRWLPRETRLVWHVLDNDNYELRRYEQAAFRAIALSNRLSVNYFGENLKTDRIEVWVTSPRWPNLLALGIVVYLLLYVMMRCRESVSSGP